VSDSHYTVAAPLFRFALTGIDGGAPDYLEASAFSYPFKLVAGVIVGGLAGWLGYLQFRGMLLQGSSGLYAAAVALMAYTLWHICRSRTRFSASGLSQSWIWNKQLPYRDLAYIKLIRIPALDWLIAPRIYTRSQSGKLAVFYVSGSQLIGEADRLVTEFTTFRRTNFGA
jgi:uncharacterized membrane protein (UPF0136 family)